MAVVHDGQPAVHARGGRSLEALFAKGIGTAADRPTIVAHFIGRHGDGISPRVGKQPAAYPEPLLGQGRMKLPRQARLERGVLLGVGHAGV